MKSVSSAVSEFEAFGVFDSFPKKHDEEVGFKKKIYQKISTISGSTIAIIVLSAIIVICIFILILFSKSMKNENIFTKELKNNLVQKEIELEQQAERIVEQDSVINLQEEKIMALVELNQRIQKWNSELNKSLENLTLEDFSEKPILDTPVEYSASIVNISREYDVPASLISAQISVESSFNRRAIFFGGNGSKIINWKQEWSKSEGRYVMYVVYKGTKKWVRYYDECSCGLGQINIVIHDQILIQKAFDAEYSIKFVCDRWRTLLDMYPDKSIIFVTMAYNTPGTAIKGEQLLDGKISSMSKNDIDKAVFITEYGKNVLIPARNQRLKEIYNELFYEFLADNEFCHLVPEQTLL